MQRAVFHHRHHHEHSDLTGARRRHKHAETKLHHDVGPTAGVGYFPYHIIASTARGARDDSATNVRLARGRMERNVFELFADAGVQVKVGSRAFGRRFRCPASTPRSSSRKTFSRCCTSARAMSASPAADWVRELGVDVVELLNTEFDPVRLVAAAPASLLQNRKLPDHPLLAATEYEHSSMPGSANGDSTPESFAPSGRRKFFLRKTPTSSLMSPPADRPWPPTGSSSSMNC